MYFGTIEVMLLTLGIGFIFCILYWILKYKNKTELAISISIWSLIINWSIALILFLVNLLKYGHDLL